MPQSTATAELPINCNALTDQFCSILESDGLEFRLIPPRSPNMNPYAETWVQRTKQEVLDHFIVFGESHLRQILAAWLVYYHQHRPHQEIGNVLLAERECPVPPTTDAGPPGEIVCHDLLGGLLSRLFASCSARSRRQCGACLRTQVARN
jgi:putative transposase